VRTPENIGLIQLAGRVDREQFDSHLITIKCFKIAADRKKLNYLRPYDPEDFSERQVLIKVEDIDDNGPVFSKYNITLGAYYLW